MFNFGNFLTKNAIAFHLTEIERKKRYLFELKFCCATNTAIENVKIARKASNFFPKIFFNKIAIFPKSIILYKKRIYIYLDSGSSSRHFHYLFICLGLIVKLYINYLQHYVEFKKKYENHVNFIF